MLRIPERFDGFEREFARKDKFLALDKTRPVETIPPKAIYISPGGEVSEDFSPKEPAAVPPISMPKLRDYITTGMEAMKKRADPEVIQKYARTLFAPKNFLDIFFDWLNKILS